MKTIRAAQALGIFSIRKTEITVGLGLAFD